MDELLAGRDRASEDMRKHSIYLKPSRVSSMISNPVYNRLSEGMISANDDMQTQMDRMTDSSMDETTLMHMNNATNLTMADITEPQQQTAEEAVIEL